MQQQPTTQHSALIRCLDTCQVPGCAIPVFEVVPSNFSNKLQYRFVIRDSSFYSIQGSCMLRGSMYCMSCQRPWIGRLGTWRDDSAANVE
jgi:hypothetical protein